MQTERKKETSRKKTKNGKIGSSRELDGKKGRLLGRKIFKIKSLKKLPTKSY